VYNPQKYWDFGLCPSSDILKKLENTTFRKLDLFPSSGEGETLTLLGSLERANFIPVIEVSPPHLRTETDPVSEKLHSPLKEYRTMDKAQKTH
jgi:hypothetical protein